jgi:hypothetical protein
MHGSQVGIAQSPLVSSSYILVTLLLVACAKLTAPAPVDVSEDEGDIAAEAASA